MLLACSFQIELFSIKWASVVPPSPSHCYLDDTQLLPPEGIHSSPSPAVISYYKPRESLEKPDVHVIENRDNRHFAKLEAHYTEPPMSHTEEYPNPHIAYQARDVYQEIHTFCTKSEDKVTTEDDVGKEVTSCETTDNTFSRDDSSETNSPPSPIHVHVAKSTVKPNSEAKGDEERNGEKSENRTGGNREVHAYERCWLVVDRS